MFNHLKKVNVDFFSVSDFYLFCKKSNRRQEFNDTVLFVICQYKGGEEWIQGGGHVLFAKYNFNLSYIFNKNILFTCIILVNSGLTSYSDCIFFKTSFAVSKPKVASSRVSDCYLTPTQQFSAITCREQVNFQ